MKSHFYKIFILIICSVAFYSCDKDDSTTVMADSIAPVLTVSISNITLSSADAQTTNALKLSWTASDYGYNAEVTYFIQLDKKGNGFASPAEKKLENLAKTSVNNVSGWSAGVSHYTLDSLISKLGVETATATDFEVRLKSVASSGPSTQPVYSAPLTLSVTPYRDVVEAAPVLTSSATTFNDKNTDPILFTWTPTKYTLENDVVYALEFDSVESFVEPVELTVAGDKKEFSIADFNTLIQDAGLILGAEGNIYVRLKSTQTGSITSPALSNVLTITATPFSLSKYLYVPGAHQGWDPSKAPMIISATGDDIYEGYVFFENANNTFKFTTHPDWDHTNYGSGGGALLSTSGGDLNVTDAGYYLIKADLKALSWSAQRTTWGVIGNATPTGWDSDTDMTYDPASKTLKVTLALTAGDIKFRANDDWEINYGDLGADDGVLDFNSNGDGANISVAEAGTYEIVLDLNDPLKYTYTLTKQ